MSHPEVTNRLHQLAEFVANGPGSAIPDAAIVRAKQALVDYVGVTIGGVDEPVSRLVRSFTARAGGRGESTTVGNRECAAPLDAAFANATTGHALDFDDSNFVLGGHPSVTLFPALLALAEHKGASGQRVLEAYTFGFEVTVRLARIVNFHHYEKGWHPTATLGIFGVAAASARMLGLDAAKTAAALALAASMASGIKQNFGTMAKPIQVGHAAQKGLLAALLAEEGATASYEALEGKQGFFAVYNGGGHYDEGSIEGLGQSWELLTSGLMFKKYACCGSTHPVIDAGIELSLRDNIDPARIDAVRVAINPRRIPHVNRPKVTDALGAKFSVQYTAAAALVDRTVGLRHFFDAVVNRADLQRLAERVEVVGLERVDGDLSQACEITVTSDEGQIHSIRLEQAKGRKAEEYEHFKRAKFLDCASRLLAPTVAERLLTRLEGFESEAAVGEVMREMSAPRAPSRTKVEA